MYDSITIPNLISSLLNEERKLLFSLLVYVNQSKIMYPTEIINTIKFDKGHSSPFTSSSFTVRGVHVAIMANKLESHHKGRK